MRKSAPSVVETRPRDGHAESDAEAALRITPLFYNAALDPLQWERALAEICAWFAPAKAATVRFDCGGATDEGDASSPLSFMYRCGTNEEAVGPSSESNNRGLEAYTRAFDAPLTRSDTVYVDNRRPVSKHEDLSQPDERDLRLAVSIANEETDTVFSVCIYRGTDGPTFSQQDTERFRLLLPHLSRAADVYTRLTGTERKSQQLEHAFDALALATIFTDTTGDILFANTPAKILLRSEDGPIELNVKLSHSTPKVASLLLEAIANVSGETQSKSPQPRIAHLSLPRQKTSPLLATVCSLTNIRQDSIPYISSQRRVAIFLTDPDQSFVATTEHLKWMFGLTDTEAMIARDVSSGMTLKDIATKNGRAHDTIRKHLKSVMKKTGARRQAELVKQVLALSIPTKG